MATETADERARTKELLVRWRENICQWAEDVIVIQRPDTGKTGPMRLEKHQRDWLRAATKLDRAGDFQKKVVVKSDPKREGKSLCVALLGAHRVSCFTEKAAVILANSKEQAASVIFDHIIGFVRNSRMLQKFISEEEIDKTKLQAVRTGGSIVCKPCNFRTVQGIPVDLLMVDELHAAPDIQAYNYLRAQTENFGAQTAISSQAGSPDMSNAVYRLWLARNEPHILFDYSDEHRTVWGRKLAEQQKAELTPAEFDALHRNLWTGLGQKLFSTDLLEAAAMDYPEPQTYGELQDLIRQWGFEGWRVTIGAGLDRALVSTTGDSSVLTATARFAAPGSRTMIVRQDDGLLGERIDDGEFRGSEHYRALRQWVFRTGSRSEIIAAFGDLKVLCGPLSFTTIMETFACSDLVEDVHDASLASPSNPVQRQMFNELYGLFKEGRIGYPSGMGFDPVKEQAGLLKTQLANFEYGLAGGLWKFGKQSGHDDTVYSLAWSCEAAPSAATTIASYQDYVMGAGSYVAEYA